MSRSKSDWLQAIADYPQLPGVYIMRDVDAQVIYVGKAKKLIKRLQSYFAPRILHPKTEILVKKIHTIDYILAEDEVAALIIEQDLIKQHQPKYNILLKDDKTYPYIMLSGGDFPRLVMVRGSLGRLQHIYPDASFLGPFPVSYRAFETLEWLQKTLKLRNCRDYDFKNRSRPCLQYQIERCSAPCVGYISAEDYQKQSTIAQQFLLKNDHPLRVLLEKMMHAASNNLAFEEAARYRDMLHFVQQLYQAEYTRVEGTSIDIWDGMMWNNTFLCGLLQVRGGVLSAIRFFEPVACIDSDVWESLLCSYYLAENRLQLPSVIRWPEFTPDSAFAHWFKTTFSQTVGRIRKEHIAKWKTMLHNNLIEKSLSHDRLARVFPKEDYTAFLEYYGFIQPWIIALDISHTQGTYTIGAMASCTKGQWDKKNSMTYQLSLKNPGDDCEAMTVLAQKIVALCKRRKHWPDLVVVDGSVLQLKAVATILAPHAETIQCIAVTKGYKRKWGIETFYRYSLQEIVPFEVPEKVKNTLLRIRDASHILAHDTHAQIRNTKIIPS